MDVRLVGFVRRSATDQVFAVFNLCATAGRVRFAQTPCRGTSVDFTTGAAVVVDEHTCLDLDPSAFVVLVADLTER